MSFYVALFGGRKIYIEHARWVAAVRGLEFRRENRELLVWLGRWHIIYTPADWQPASGDMLDGRRAI